MSEISIANCLAQLSEHIDQAGEFGPALSCSLAEVDAMELDAAMAAEATAEGHGNNDPVLIEAGLCKAFVAGVLYEKQRAS